MGDIESKCWMCNRQFHSKEPYIVIAEMDNIKDTCRITRYLCTGCYHDVCELMKRGEEL